MKRWNFLSGLRAFQRATTPDLGRDFALQHFEVAVFQASQRRREISRQRNPGRCRRFIHRCRASRSWSLERWRDVRRFWQCHRGDSAAPRRSEQLSSRHLQLAFRSQSSAPHCLPRHLTVLAAAPLGSRRPSTPPWPAALINTRPLTGPFFEVHYCQTRQKNCGVAPQSDLILSAFPDRARSTTCCSGAHRRLRTVPWRSPAFHPSRRSYRLRDKANWQRRG